MDDALYVRQLLGRQILWPAIEKLVFGEADAVPLRERSAVLLVRLQNRLGRGAKKNRFASVVEALSNAPQVPPEPICFPVAGQARVALGRGSVGQVENEHGLRRQRFVRRDPVPGRDIDLEELVELTEEIGDDVVSYQLAPFKIPDDGLDLKDLLVLRENIGAPCEEAVGCDDARGPLQLLLHPGDVEFSRISNIGDEPDVGCQSAQEITQTRERCLAEVCRVNTSEFFARQQDMLVRMPRYAFGKAPQRICLAWILVGRDEKLQVALLEIPIDERIQEACGFESGTIGFQAELQAGRSGLGEPDVENNRHLFGRVWNTTARTEAVTMAATSTGFMLVLLAASTLKAPARGT